MAPKKMNGFMYFTLEWKEKHGQNMTMSQATTSTGELWKEMSEKQREPYLKRAQAAPQPEQKKNIKHTCLGTPINVIEKEHKEKEKWEKKTIKTIERTIKLAIDGRRLEKEKVYFITVNYFIRLLNAEVYVPAEIAIVEFSLLGGITRKYHTLVNPRNNLYGQVYEAQNHADSTHKLPLPPNAMGENDMRKISSDIFKFIFDENTGLYPPLYTHSNAMGYVSSSLSSIAKDAESENDDLRDLDIFPIQDLFYALKCATCDLAAIKKPRNRFICDAVLERNPFEYSKNIACYYHDEVDRSNYCALSQAVCWGFSFADYICKDLSITFVPGCHMPSTFDASIVRKGTSSCVESVTDAISLVSLESKYNCNDNGQDSSLKTSKKTVSQTVQKPIITEPQFRVNEHDIDLYYSMSESSCNPWRRSDDSKPPDNRFFSIDYQKDEEESVLSTSRRVRGRGIAILDDYQKDDEKGVLSTSRCMRGRGIAILEDYEPA